MTSSVLAQQRIAHVQPDALGPGMTIAMEVLAPAKDTGAFGIDGIYLPSSKILLQNPSDTNKIVLGPIVVSWNGRVLQVPILAKSDAKQGKIFFQILTGNKRSEVGAFEILRPQPKLSIYGGAILGTGNFGAFSFSGNGNTIVTDGVDFSGSGDFDRGVFIFSKINKDSLSSGNPHYHPVTLLSRGPIRLQYSEISVSAVSLNGGPGGGGGGHGWSGTGGEGYTGGGSDSNYSPNNIGSGLRSTIFAGGASSTGVAGGESADSLTDQGGGGGTGCPYGSSGSISESNDSSHVGGFGGGSAGGETTGLPFGGGGGGFATAGSSGSGNGDNGGKPNGGRFLLPMQGGSGGGAGNHVSEIDSTAGSGGGGGGAITLISYDSLSFSGSIINAKGSGGTSGLSSEDAGGGGGSGGGILISARNGIAFDSTVLTTLGGNGGEGGVGIEQISKGGDGGLGRIRIDGNIHPPTSASNSISGVSISGPTLDIPSAQLKGPFTFISGMAGDAKNLTDTIRIYYRNQHSGWNIFDTLRFKDNDGNYRWRVLLPTGHDSTLFISSVAQVKKPSAAIANSEPERLLSHLSSGIIRVKATPHLVLNQDTLIFGCYKINDTCVRANLFFSNLGEDSLHIISVQSTKNNFRIISSGKNIGYYSQDSAVIEYCPKTVGKDTAIITFISNDTLRTAILIGCGIDKDTRITLKPLSLDFGRVHAGACDTAHITAYSTGKDSALIDPNGWIHSPFAIISPSKPVLVAPKDSVRITMVFCPNDSGVFHSSFIFTEKRDSVKLTGRGTRRILRVEHTLNGTTLCLHSCDTIKTTFSSDGNDPLRITGIVGATFIAPLPIIIPPKTDTEFTIRYCSLTSGDTSIPISYQSDADSSAQSLINFHTLNPQFFSDSLLQFPTVCISAQENLSFSIRKTGKDSMSIDSIRLKNGTPYSLSGTISSGKDTANSVIHFSPLVAGISTDSVFAFIHLGQCGDTVLIIPVSGSAVNGDVVFSKTTLLFGSMDTGRCKIDSLSITNPCQGQVQLTIPPISEPFSIIEPTGNSIIFKGGESKTVIYRYCPKQVKTDSIVQAYTLSSGALLPVILTGEGLPVIDSPSVKFSLGKTTVLAGETFSYPITVDSLSQTAQMFSLSASLLFDPTVIKPIGMTSSQWTITNNSEVSPGVYHFTASGSKALFKGVVASVEMLALLGQRDTTSVFLDNIKVINYAQTTVIPGSVTVVSCGNLPGNIVVAGEYYLGNPTPNPSGGNILFPVTLGSDGVLGINIYNENGSSALKKIYQLKRGEHTITVDVSPLPSGIYYLRADSWGWREGKTFVIQK
jgi:hypothetical protein